MSTTTKDFTSTPPGAISKNLKRLREESDLGASSLAKEVGSTWATINAMETRYEPPSNHPLVGKIAVVLAEHSGKERGEVLEDLIAGGAPFEFSPARLSRITKSHKPGFFTNKKPERKTRQRTAPQGVKYSVLLKFLNNDPRIRSLAKKAGILLPNAKTNAVGKPVGKSTFAIRERAVKLMEFLKENEVDVALMISGQPETPKSNIVHRNGRRGLGDIKKIVLTCVATFNHRRTEGERIMVVAMDDFEILMQDYLKLTGINTNILIGADIAKLQK